MSAQQEQLTVHRTDLDGVLLIEPPTQFEDFRGEYVELYNERIYKAAGIEADFVQDDISISDRHVLRGIHGDGHTTKLISCLWGRFYAVVVNCKEGDPNFGKWVAATLSEKNRKQLLVPPGHGLSHLILSERAIFHYKQSSLYDRASQFTYRYDEPRFNIYWPVERPILSARDALKE